MILEIYQRISAILQCEKCYNFSITDDEKKDYLHENGTHSFSDSSCSNDIIEVELAEKSKRKKFTQMVVAAYRQQKSQQKIIKARVYNDIRKKFYDPELASRRTKEVIQRTVTRTKQTFFTQLSNFPKRNNDRKESRQDQESMNNAKCEREGISSSSTHGRRSSNSDRRNKHRSKKQLQFSNQSMLNSKVETGIESHCWSNANAGKFSVRGPQYIKNKTKVTSSPSLYEVILVRCFSSNHRTSEVANLFPLPVMKEESSSLHPQILIIHVQLPHETPNLFRSKDDGIGIEVRTTSNISILLAINHKLIVFIDCILSPTISSVFEGS